MKTRLAATALLVALVASCTGSIPLGRQPVVVAGALQVFQSCQAFLDYVKGHALEVVTPWGLPGQYGGPFVDFAVAEAAGDGARSTIPAALNPGVDYSTTNVQVAGVDEPDVVKTDGERILALAQGRLWYVDLEEGRPVMRGSLRLDGQGWPQEILLSGDRVFVLSSGSGGEVVPMARSAIWPPGHYSQVAALTEVDVSDPDAPRIVRTLHVDGSYVSARAVGDLARVVVASYPTGLEFVHPEGPGLRAEREALEENRRVIEQSTLESWVPYYVLEDAGGDVTAEGTLLDCSRAHHPEEFSGLGMLNVLTVNLARGLEPSLVGDSVGVLSEGETVYASATGLYVATRRWMDPEAASEPESIRPFDGSFRTQIHRFDISSPGGAAYRSSGEVRGWLLNQWSMDEHDGRLRVASTDSPPWWADEESESLVTVLEERSGRLVEVGLVEDLGRGERIYAVRFMGDIGYVVTFRQTDPLYVLDLREPESPQVTGELKILGYSAYLHPVGEGLLLGVGQDADDRGRVKGTQLSLFDVSDPADPRRIDQLQIADAHSEAEWDHRAFLWWEPARLVVVPLNVYRWDPATEKESGFTGAIGVGVGEAELTERGRIAHGANREPDWSAQLRRSIVVGDRLFTISELGVEAAELASLDEVAWVPFR